MTVPETLLLASKALPFNISQEPSSWTTKSSIMLHSGFLEASVLPEPVASSLEDELIFETLPDELAMSDQSNLQPETLELSRVL
jgi:hypothetical protein